jgi:hypothetical protein
LETRVATFVPPPHQVVGVWRERIRWTLARLALGEAIHSIPALDGTPTDPELTGDGVDLPPLLFEDLQPRIATHAQCTLLVLSPLLATEAAET